MAREIKAGGYADETGDGLDLGAVVDGEDVCCGLEDFAEEEGCFAGLGVGRGGFDDGGEGVEEA
jgi:hypothetical protein